MEYLAHMDSVSEKARIIFKLLEAYTLTKVSQVTGNACPATHLHAAGIACIVNAK